ncbi:PREDICTED: uncharacterized protein LOC109463501 [Branchiostoma belcheri]|uniref:Uncharacterized protein LOC109463501 n=1 Tax=Branchiostoma belcheri TaxID=7741 RepID=A0A6P4XZN4_BRABE|nr:PREDICTED: uncharacterized protein LOC109463501 [Branchiostoma belcheri]
MGLLKLEFVVAICCARVGTSLEQGNHAFEVLRTANQKYRGVDFLAIQAKLPADGLSTSPDWCSDYENLCAGYGLRPTGCGENWAVEGGSESDPGRIRCVTEYNSDPYINNVLGCHAADHVAEVARLAFSATNIRYRSFGFDWCTTSTCQRGIWESLNSLYDTGSAFGPGGTGDRIVYTVCAGSAAQVANLAFSAGATGRRSFGFNNCRTDFCERGIYQSLHSLWNTGAAFGSDGSGDRIVYTVCAGSADTDECATDNGGCAHNCTNIPGSYNCSCQHSFILTNVQQTTVDVPKPAPTSQEVIPVPVNRVS